MCKKFCIYKKLYIFVRSIRHNIKKNTMKAILKLTENEIVTIPAIELNNYLDTLIELGYDIEKVELIKMI